MKLRFRRLSKPIIILIACTVPIGFACWVTLLYHESMDIAVCASLTSSAASGENSEVERLLKAGTDPNCEHGDPLRHARQGGHEDTVDLLKRYGAKE